MSSPAQTTVNRHVGSRELKARLGTYLRQVREGATLVVTDRGRPVAELRPLPTQVDTLSGALGDLTARGVLGGNVRERPRLRSFEPIANLGAPVSDAIATDREDRF